MKPPKLIPFSHVTITTDRHKILHEFRYLDNPTMKQKLWAISKYKEIDIALNKLKHVKSNLWIGLLKHNMERLV